MNTQELKQQSADIESFNRALAENTQLLDNGAFKEVEVTGLVYKNGVIKGGSWTTVTLNKPHFENMVFDGVNFSQVVIEGGVFSNVTFKNCEFKIRRNVWDGSNYFEPDQMDNITLDGNTGNDFTFFSQENSNATESRLLLVDNNFDLPDPVFNRDEYAGRGLLIDGDFDQIFILRSTLSGASVKTFKPANHLIIKDSTIKRSSFSSRELVKHYIVLDSEVDAGSPLKTDLMYVRGSSIKGNIPESEVTIVKDSKSVHIGMRAGKTNLVYISGCTSDANKLYVGRSKINRIIVKNCDLDDVLYYAMQGNELTLCNVTLGKADFEDSHLQNGYWQNVHLNGPINLTNARIGTLHSHEVSGEEDVWEGLESVKVGRMNRCTEPMAFPEVEAIVAEAEQSVAALLKQLEN